VLAEDDVFFLEQLSEAVLSAVVLKLSSEHEMLMVLSEGKYADL
jgi:hypothetical protein